MARKRKDNFSEFKPDPQTTNWLKTAHLTQLQRLRLGKWLLYVLLIVLALVLQDVVMSQISFFGATTNLPVCVILLITIIEGTESGSLFVLIAATLYYFTGTAPGAYSIGLLIFPGVLLGIFRQMYLHRSRGSIVLCAGMAAMIYELGLFLVGIFMKLTIWSRFGIFLLTGVIDILVMIPLYPLIHKIGLIGGSTWKE